MIRAYPANTKHLANVPTMLEQRRRRWANIRWANIGQTLVRCVLFAQKRFAIAVEALSQCWFNVGQASHSLK